MPTVPDDLEHPFGNRVGGQVKVARGAAEESVPHRPADQRQFVPGAREQLAQFGRVRSKGTQQHSGRLTLVGTGPGDGGGI